MHFSSETLPPICQLNSLDINLHGLNTEMRRLTTWIHSEKCVVRRFRRCANVMECTYRLQPGHYSSLTAPNLQHMQTKNEMTSVVINIIVASS